MYFRKTKLKLDSWKNRLLCVIMVLFGIEPVLCYMQYIHYAIKMNIAKDQGITRKTEKYYSLMSDQNRDVVDLKLYEGCMEAVPQLILQFSVILKKYDEIQLDVTRKSNF